jgi:copper chaperone CopZ
MVHTYNVTGMHCKSCVEKTTEALRSVPGVTAAEVTLEPPRARVKTAGHVPNGRLFGYARVSTDGVTAIMRCSSGKL